MYYYQSMSTSKTKTSKNALNLTAIILAAITVVLAIMTVANVLAYGMAQANMINRTSNNFTSHCVNTDYESGDVVLEESLDEELVQPLDEESLNEDCIIRDDVWSSNMELGTQLIASQYHGTIVTLLAATLISFAIDMAYFSLLRK